MEASEKPQLPLDGPGEAVVRVLEDRLVIERLDVSDERAARVVRERAKAGRRPAETVEKAIEIGARVLDTEETAANVDYVRAEFERHAGALRERLVRSLEEGDTRLGERIAESFDGSRDGSVQKDIDRLVAQALEQQRTALLKLFSAEEGANPLQDFKGAMIRAFKALDSRQQAEGEENRKRIDALTRELVELKAEREADERVAEAEEAGTRKGRTFEDLAYGALDRIASERGDAAHAVGDASSEAGGKKGDVVVEVEGGSGPPICRIVFEAKNKKLSKNDAWAELNAAMSERDASFAVLVVASEEKVPSGTQEVQEYQGNKMIVVLDREDPDPTALAYAYRYARARALMVGHANLAVDATGVRDSAEQAAAALKRANAIRKALTGVTRGADTAREQLNEMIGEVERCLLRIESLIAEADEAEASGA
jgi:Uncharacterized protein conserved in bacteria (DUF2130)